MASDEQIRRMIEEIEKLRGQIRNSKAKVKKRIKKLEKTFDPMERQEIEFEIELLKRKIQRWEIVETKSDWIPERPRMMRQGPFT